MWFSLVIVSSSARFTTPGCWGWFSFHPLLCWFWYFFLSLQMRDKTSVESFCVTHPKLYQWRRRINNWMEKVRTGEGSRDPFETLWLFECLFSLLNFFSVSVSSIAIKSERDSYPNIIPPWGVFTDFSSFLSLRPLLWLFSAVGYVF